MEAKINWLDDPEVFAVNRLPAHSDHPFYADGDRADEGESSLVMSLNGTWQFWYSPCAAKRPAEFYRPGYDGSGADEIRVPGHIELAGYDKIHYINTMYPWEGHYWRRPAYSLEGIGSQPGMFSEADYNPVGSYRRVFDLPGAFCGKRVTVRFAGVEQAMYVWLNGQFVGYAEDSFAPSEFDLTPYIRETGNVLAVEVHKRSTAAFLEDQDFFRFFGIFRDVTLYAKPWMHVEDLWAKPVLHEDGTGELELELQISAAKCPAGKIAVSLTDADGRMLLAEEGELQAEAAADGTCGWQESRKEEEQPHVSSRSAGTHVSQKSRKEEEQPHVSSRSAGTHISQECGESAGDRTEWQLHYIVKKRRLGAVEPWENGHPYLYQLNIRLYDEEGHLVELVPYRIGFRSLTLADRVIRLNGKRLVINGVNRHEWSAKTGRCIGAAEMEQDMQAILRNHINAVRTCHYPDQLIWYSLCDENGIYLMAEANLESHGSWQKMGAVEPSWNVPGSLPQWREAVLDRIRSNFELFKNHPSVLFWSLGNESYAGDVLQEANAWLKERDVSRLVHYEGVSQNRAYEDVISDVESRMYATPEEVREYLTNDPKKPFLLCEYMHDMGNSLGGMGSYMELSEEFPMYQGGFIWDFIDQAIEVEDEVTGRPVLRYGGDFDDRPSDYAFSGNGILFADRTEKPAMQEVRYYYGRYSQRTE